MKCLNPNCNETEHEPGAKYCHCCGQKFAPKWLASIREFRTNGQILQTEWKRLRLRQKEEKDYSISGWFRLLRDWFKVWKEYFVNFFR